MKRSGCLILVFLITISLTSCGGNGKSTVGKKKVGLSIGSYTVVKVSPLDLLFPSAYAAISELKVCFKRLRFKKDLEATVDPLVEDNVDLNLGEVTLTGLGLDLGQVEIEAGLYKRIEFDLEKDCVDGVTSNSVSIMNDYGTYGSQSRITIKFEGSFDLTENTSLQLGIQNIVDAVNAYDGVGTIKDTLEGVSGEL